MTSNIFYVLDWFLPCVVVVAVCVLLGLLYVLISGPREEG